MFLTVWLLNIALLLLPVCFNGARQTEARANPGIGQPVSAKPFMTGIRLSSADGQQQLFVLQIESLELMEKTWGPFQLEDQRDVAVNNCYLRSDSASLAGNLQEIEKFLLFMMKSLKNPSPQPINAPPAKPGARSAAYPEKLVGLPPTFKARPFACALSRPQGLETRFQADLATFDPTQADVTLTGNVKVRGDDQTCLTAEQIIWQVASQELLVEGAYGWQTGEQQITGQNTRFSIAGGRLAPIKFSKAQALPSLRELPPSIPVAPFMSSPGRKGWRVGKKTILSQLSRTLLQNMSATVAKQEQPLTPEKPRLTAASFPYCKPTVYPPSRMAHTLEETFDREFFCEKNR